MKEDAHNYRPYVWMGEEQDAHVKDWRASRDIGGRAVALAQQIYLNAMLEDPWTDKDFQRRANLQRQIFGVRII